MTYTQDSALKRIQSVGAKVDVKARIIVIPRDGMGIKALGAMDFLVKKHGFIATKLSR